jgi:hypothetical protein
MVDIAIINPYPVLRGGATFTNAINLLLTFI